MTRNSNSSGRRPRRPATSPEGRENQLISLAYDLAEKRMVDGTASATEVVHFLKAGSSRNKLECLKIENENLLLSAKVDQLASAKRIEELYEDAIRAMRKYSGQEDVSEEFDEFEDFNEL